MVKICGITRLEDARAAFESGASAIGFNFYRDSPRYISATGASLISDKLPPGLLKVGVFVDENPEAITRIANHVGLDVVQLHGRAECASFTTWRAMRVGEVTDFFHFNEDSAQAYLFDAAVDGLHGGTGQTFPWQLAKDAQAHTSKHIIIAGGLDASNVRVAIQQARPWGVDVCSRIESQPGRKDHDKMRQFIQAALAASQ